MDLRKKLHESVLSLHGWVTKNGWAGYDPYDIQHWRVLLPGKLSSGTPLRWPVAAAVRIGEMFPMWSRRLLVPKRVFPKAMGLFVHAYSRLSQLIGAVGYEDIADECAVWLLANRSPGYEGLGWGLPLGWQTRMFIPAGTPCATVGAVCGDAFFELYQRTGNERYLDTCLEVCRGFVKDLNIDEMGPDAICFSYTPLDHFHVHNANLMVAAFLAKVGRAAGRDDLLETASRAGNYALVEQREDGSLDYWGRDQSTGLHRDLYHSGFEIRALDTLGRHTGRIEFREAAERYFAFFKGAYFDSEGAPFRNPGDPGVIDIHGCAEAMICCAQVESKIPDAGEILSRVTQWTIDNMQMSDGAFAYRLLNLDGRARRIDTPFIRWGQAWMMRALAAAMEALTDGGNGRGDG
ncbi:MAG: hypothetical protein GXP54_05455 [Deltaproteobacteria bacterium]|nr:hypothetical protein [Deltaproteobacteria bacterium]